MPCRLPSLHAVLVVLALSIPARDTEKEYELKVVTDRPDAVYSLGETATFLVTLD